MFQGKPIIGIAGGIGSGKSFVARCFGELGCVVLDADEMVREAYTRPQVKAALRRWWGEGVFTGAGDISYPAVAARVFGSESERRRLEQLLHPVVFELGAARMAGSAVDPQVLAFVWDAPLLFEAGMAGDCDAVVFVDCPRELRLQRVREGRGWDEAELVRREKAQWPLDKKREMSHDVVCNAGGADDVRRQVREVLPRILAEASPVR